MTIRPHPPPVMAGTAALVTRKEVVRLRSSAARHVGTLMVCAVPDSKSGSATETIPALLTRMSSRPQRSTAADTSPAAVSSAVRSPLKPAASKPASRSSAARSSIRAVVELMSTAAPSSASSLAAAKPMPCGLPAPVTMATRPDRSNAAGIGIARS